MKKEQILERRIKFHQNYKIKTAQIFLVSADAKRYIAFAEHTKETKHGLITFLARVTGI